MLERNQLEGYLTIVMQRFSVDEAHAVLMRFMCRCLMIVRKFLPESWTERRWTWRKCSGWRARDEAANLLASRVDCWNYLDAKHRSAEIRDQEDAALRAVTFVFSTLIPNLKTSLLKQCGGSPPCSIVWVTTQMRLSS